MTAHVNAIASEAKLQATVRRHVPRPRCGPYPNLSVLSRMSGKVDQSGRLRSFNEMKLVAKRKQLRTSDRFHRRHEVRTATSSSRTTRPNCLRRSDISVSL